MSEGLIRIQLHVDTGLAGCNYEDVQEVSKAEWDALGEQGQVEFLDEAAREFRDNLVSCNAWVITDDEGEML